MTLPTDPTARLAEAAPRNTPAQALADGLAAQVHQWSVALGAPPDRATAAAEAARHLSLANSDGHVCIGLERLPPVPASSAPTRGPAAARGGDAETDAIVAWRSHLLDSGVVGTPAAPGSRPLVLDGRDRLYLHRDFALERRLARRLIAALGVPPEPPDTGAPQAANADEPDWQALAAALALRGRLTIVSGGPGTGKTTAVVQLLARLLTRDPGCRIALAAPTGKAAARMTEAIRQRAGALPEALRARLPTTASTVHRLLGVSPAMRGGAGEGFAHHAGRPLPIDLLVIDEASMLDLALATRLLEAVPPRARIVLLGDQDQLAAVESGAVFAELSADPGLSPACIGDLARACGLPPAAVRPPAPRAATGLRDCVVWFTRQFRFGADSAIGRLARQVQAGDAAAALAGLEASTPGVTSVGSLATGVGATTVDRAMTVGGAPTVGSAMAVGGAPTVGSAMAVGGAPTVGSAMAVGGAATAGSVETLGRPTVGGTDGVAWWPDAASALGAATEEALGAGYEGYAEVLQAALRGEADAEEVLEAFDRYRVLAALRVGPRGVAALNRRLARRFRARLGTADTAPASAWYPGRPVLVTRNDPLLRLFNGDVGIALPGEGPEAPLQVCFADAERGVRRVAPVRLPEHDDAWALTVHQSQGSEFDAVAVVLPAEPHRVLSRELLYTAVTRARHAVRLVGPASVIAAAIDAPTRRHSGLIDRIAEEVAAQREG
jgi:exodeoxyribonuclease V alpha subunit